jgi:putative membrane protein
MRTAVSLLALGLLAACANGQEVPASETADETAAAAEPVTAAPAADGPSDAQIAAIVLTANSADSTAGVLAASKATDARVKEFGQRMATDHGAVNQQAVALATRLGLTPEENPTSRSLAQDGEQNLQTLQGLSGAAFDRAYIDHEVALHQQVLDALDQTLLPSAQNAELKGLLEKGRPVFVGHLDMAKQLQSSLGGS